MSPVEDVERRFTKMVKLEPGAFESEMINPG